MTVTFFGHRDTPQTVLPALESLVRELVVKEGADRFYVGSQGAFDAMAKSALTGLKKEHPNVQCAVVLAYLPEKAEESGQHEPETVFPEGLESAPRRFAIHRRNCWMVQQADVVVTYVKSPAGGAAQFQAMALRLHKRVINLAETVQP